MTSEKEKHTLFLPSGGFRSGQTGQTVNLLALPSMVRIHLRPFRDSEFLSLSRTKFVCQSRSEKLIRQSHLATILKGLIHLRPFRDSEFLSLSRTKFVCQSRSEKLIRRSHLATILKGLIHLRPFRDSEFLLLSRTKFVCQSRSEKLIRRSHLATILKGLIHLRKSAAICMLMESRALHFAFFTKETTWCQFL